jgi:preprotein translocase subunit SecA
MLKRAGVRHNVLNAKQHQREAEIVMSAGEKGAVTIATNMAGRGTDIKPDPAVKEAGGLVILGTERHESRRIDRQLRGRSGRQGDPGISQFYISLEDDLMRLFQGDRIASVMQRLKVPEGEPIQSGMVTKSVENAQKKVEGNNFSIRKRLLEYDNVMNQQREVIYDRRRHALQGERLKSEILDYVADIAGDLYDEYHELGDAQAFKNEVRTSLLCDLTFPNSEFEGMSRDRAIELIEVAAHDFYKRKEEMLGEEFMAAIERYAWLQTIDDQWRDHLRSMDDLKEGIYLRAYGQKDPLLEYKQEAYKVFVDLVKSIDKEIVQRAFKYFPQTDQRQARATQRSAERQPASTSRAAVEAGIPEVRSNVTATRNLQFSHASPSSALHASHGGDTQQATATVRNEGRIFGRNEACPAGTGKKFKHCCGADGHKTCVKI